MTSPAPEMLDVVFEVSGGTLPQTYAFELWSELVRLVPRLAEHESIGVIPLRLAESKEGLLLPKRAKLVLRLPREFAGDACELAQQQLLVTGCPIQLGSCKSRPIQHYPTLHSHLVTGVSNEIDFVARVESELAAMGVKAKLICGRHREISDGSRRISGFSLVMHDLTPDGSLRVQFSGLGKERRFGCGVFVPYKVISSAE